MQNINVTLTPYFVRKARKLLLSGKIRTVSCPVALATHHALRRHGVTTVLPCVRNTSIYLTSGDESTAMDITLPNYVARFILEFDFTKQHRSYPEFTLSIPDKIFNSWKRKTPQEAV